MVPRTRRWLDGVVDITALRCVVWLTIVLKTFPGIVANPWKLADWFDDHSLYGLDEFSRVTLLRYGQLPAWNPFWCGGTAGIREPENSFYSPDFVLRLVFGSEHGRRLAIVLLFVLGLEGTYRLARRLDASAIPAAFAAVAYATCERFVSFIHDGWVHFMSFQLVPWVLVSLIAGIDSFRWRLVGGAALAWMILAPGTYSTPYCAIAFGYVFLALVIHRFATGREQPLKGPVVSALTIGVFALLLAFCKLAPTVSYMREFPRVFKPTETHAPLELIGTLVPKYDALVCAMLIGLVTADLATGICLGGAFLFFALAMGEFGPYAPFHFIKQLPVLSALRYPDRFILITIFFLALGGARGLTIVQDAIPRIVSGGWRWLSGLVPRLPKLPNAVVWGATLLAAWGMFQLGTPYIEELTAPLRERSMALYVEPPPREFDQGFKQHRGNRRDAQIFPKLNMGSLNCVVGMTVPESARLRGDLPQEEYPADPNVAKVERVSWSPNVIVLAVEAKAPTRIYVNQNWSRYWKASEGRVVNEEGLLAVDVPAGSTRLELRYRDWLILFSLFVSLGTVAVAIHFGVRHLVRVVRREVDAYATLPTYPDES
jgi:hypothetical protein